MTNEEARTALGDRNNLLWGMSKEEQEYYSEALDMAISALSTEGEYIKKETLLKYCTYVELANGNKGWVLEKGYIEDLPAVSFPNREKVGTCSKCGKWGKLIGIQDEKFKLWVCPNCGADMRGKAE